MSRAMAGTSLGWLCPVRVGVGLRPHSGASSLVRERDCYPRELRIGRTSSGRTVVTGVLLYTLYHG